MAFKIVLGNNGRILITQENEITKTPMALEKTSNSDVVLSAGNFIQLLESMADEETMKMLNKHLKMTVGCGFKLTVNSLDKTLEEK